jgi:hypothetical protein
MDEEQLLQKHSFVKDGDSYVKRDKKGRRIRYAMSRANPPSASICIWRLIEDKAPASARMSR